MINDQRNSGCSREHLFPYQKKSLSKRLGVGGQVGMGLGGAYVAAGSYLSGAPQIVDQFARGLAERSPLFRVGAGVAGAFYGYRGIRTLTQSDRWESTTDKRWRQARAAADLVTAVGFASQAFGGGLWAAGITGVGLLASTTLQISNSIREVE